MTKPKNEEQPVEATDEKSEGLKVRHRTPIVELDDQDDVVEEVKADEEELEEAAEEVAEEAEDLEEKEADPKAARRAQLLAELAALGDDEEEEEAPDAELPAAEAPVAAAPAGAPIGPPPAAAPVAAPDAAPAGTPVDDEEEDDEELEARRLDARRRRLSTMGKSLEEIDEAIENKSIMCAIDRNLVPGAQPCAWCRGGCVPEGKAAPGLLDIEGAAEADYGAEVTDSGYDSRTDMYVLNLRRKDGKLIEAYYTGSGESSGWFLLSQVLEDGEMGEKSAQSTAFRKVISMDEAQEIALKQVDGIALGVSPAVFEGYDSWLVEIDKPDEKSVDVYVALDGTPLGMDEYDSYEETDEPEVKELLAELALKRAFSPEKREELAEMGHALPDGSFPIVNREDLMNAIKAYGRAKHPDLAQAHIMKRAVELDADDLIPEEWMPEKKKDEKAPEAVAEEKGLPSTALVDGEEDPSLLMDLVEFSVLQSEIEEGENL